MPVMKPFVIIIALVCFPNLNFTFTINKQVDLRKESIIQFTAPSSYPVVTVGLFASPTDVLKSLSRAICNILTILDLIGLLYLFYSLTQFAFFVDVLSTVRSFHVLLHLVHLLIGCVHGMKSILLKMDFYLTVTDRVRVVFW